MRTHPSFRAAYAGSSPTSPGSRKAQPPPGCRPARPDEEQCQPIRVITRGPSGAALELSIQLTAAGPRPNAGEQPFTASNGIELLKRTGRHQTAACGGLPSVRPAQTALGSAKNHPNTKIPLPRPSLRVNADRPRRIEAVAVWRLPARGYAVRPSDSNALAGAYSALPLTSLPAPKTRKPPARAARPLGPPPPPPPRRRNAPGPRGLGARPRKRPELRR